VRVYAKKLRAGRLPRRVMHRRGGFRPLREEDPVLHPQPARGTGPLRVEEPIRPLPGLRTRYGQVTCLAPYAWEHADIRIANCDDGCTRSATQTHEETHVADVLDCCLRWRSAARPVYSATAVNAQLALRTYSQWLDWLGANRDFLEARADNAQLAALRRLERQHACGQAGSADRPCCARISRWTREITQSMLEHQRQAGGGLTACPWPRVTASGSPSIQQAAECHGGGSWIDQISESIKRSPAASRGVSTRRMPPLSSARRHRSRDVRPTAGTES